LSPKIPVERIIEDIRAGLGDVPIMEKYQISPGDLLRIKNQLHPGRQNSGRTVTPATSKQRRSLSRDELLRPIIIYDAHDPRIKGMIGDISMKGLQVEGITVRTGEIRTLMIRSEPYNVHGTLLFEVECRWSTTDESGNCVAGFRIRRISQEGVKELRKLLASLAVSAGSR
jgi:hypothetical protein